jgi:hypothetical protein
MKKGVNVQTMLSVALALLFVIAAALMINLIFPHSSRTDCMKGQRLNIEKVNSTANEAKVTGVTTITKFRVESCVECIWYEDPLKLKIRWIGMSETEGPETIGVSVAWNGIGSNGETDSCPSNSKEGDIMCTVQISSNLVEAAC